MQLLISYSNTIHGFQLQKTKVLRMQPRHPATLTQPLNCDLQPQIQETQRTTHTGTTTPCRTQRSNAFRDRNDRSRTRRTHEVPFIAGCSHFTRKNTRFRAPASSPKQNPCNIHAANTMCFAASRNKPASLYAHGNTRSQQSCSHSNAICNHRFNTRKELRTQEQPLVAEHRGVTHSRQKRPQPHPPHTRGTFHRRLQPLFTRKNTGFALRLPPQNKTHATFMQPLRCVLQHHETNLHPPLRTWQHQITKIMQPFQSDPQPQIQHTNRTTHTGTTTRYRTQRRNTFATENDRSRARRTHEVPFIAGCSHFTRKNTRFRAPASSPKQSPCNIMQPSQLHWVYCYVMSSLTPPFSECIVIWCKVSHHPSLSVLLCDVKSHTTLHWVYCYMM